MIIKEPVTNPDDTIKIPAFIISVCSMIKQFELFIILQFQ